MRKLTDAALRPQSRHFKGWGALQCRPVKMTNSQWSSKERCSMGLVPRRLPLHWSLEPWTRREPGRKRRGSDTARRTLFQGQAERKSVWEMELPAPRPSEKLLGGTS